jgi:imidazolonepropionase-like amidohydrolase
MRKAVVVFSAWLVAASLCFGQTLSPTVRAFVKVDAPVIALTHVRVIDGTGAAAREDQTIIIANGRILSIDAPTSESPPHATILNLTGYTVIPGLVGMHDHMFYPTGQVVGEMAFSFARLYLAAGVTSIRTTGSIEPYTDIELKREIDSALAVGPKMHLTAPYLEGSESSDVQMHHLRDADDARKMVDFWADQGMTSFKVYAHIHREELKAAIDQAHKRGLKITGHLCSIGFGEAAALGIDNLEHGLLTDTEFYSGKKPDTCDNRAALLALATMEVADPRIQGMIRNLVAHHLAVTSTLAVFENFVPGRPPLQKRVLDAMAPDARSAYLESRVTISDNAAAVKRYGPGGSPWPKLFQMEMQFERAFVKAGGLLLAGEDPTGIGGVLAGFGDQREVELLVEAGFTPLEAIHIAAANGAQFLGDWSIGTLAPSKAADLVVLKGDPSKNISDIENVEMVFKDGVGYDSQKLVDSVRRHVGLD